MFPDSAGTIQKQDSLNKIQIKNLKKPKKFKSSIFTKVIIHLRELIALILFVIGTWLLTGVVLYLLFVLFENDINEQFIRKYSADDKSCLIKTKKHELTGTRTYSYTYIDIFGYRIRRNSTVQETTRLNISGFAVTIAGMNIDNSLPVKLSIDSGEKYSQLLDKADTYIFTLGEGRMKEIVNVSYSKLCK